MEQQIRHTDSDWQAELLPELEVLRPIGSGGTGTVHLARETSLDRLVALKVLDADRAADAVARQRFEREAQSAARISHPHVTAIHRVGRLRSGAPYIVMEYIDGRTVRDILESGGAFDHDTARSLLAAVASALAAAHDHGIVHRDVRPGNIFIESRSGRAVLADFGIAALPDSAAARLTMAGTLLGEPRYLSPEQVRGEPVTRQADVYAFGVLAYEVLTGEGPYPAAADAQMLTAHLRGEPRRLVDLRADVDPAVASLIERCLAKEPNRRPLSSDLAAALAAPSGPRWATGPAQATAGPLGPFLDELRRRRVYRTLAAYGAVAIAILGAAQVVYDAFALSRLSYQVLVLTTLAGFPIVLVLSWLYDIRSGRIRRTRDSDAAVRARGLVRAGLAASVIGVVLIAWLLLREN